MLYIISLILILAFYALSIKCMKHMRNVRLWNFLFGSVIFACYAFVIVRVYSSVGFYDWNFQNTLPVANVSPFMFTLVGVIWLVPKRARRHLYLLISLLSVGMLLSSVFGCIYNASINYKFHLHFLSDYIAHAVLSLWGVYLIQSCQVKLSVKNALISGGIIIGVALAMLGLNVIFDTAFFGLSLNGKHNIYNMVLTDNSYESAGLYFIGLTGVLLLGCLYSGIIAKRSSLRIS